eukprot:CAMPEP_0185269900 /NCGR_PEP_ID=MMETSP1359-20130426/41031_1 /TAXON_ID=552665 /ORGANISM="Bigelowiella longifila, Strain CCMP242" /LENGTH=106 /DNA_ID=CAMNT_0027861267 /DNA_START=45 /DNA_END=362 /DNA_ORIENTATION=-
MHDDDDDVEMVYGMRIESKLQQPSLASSPSSFIQCGKTLANPTPHQCHTCLIKPPEHVLPPLLAMIRLHAGAILCLRTQAATAATRHWAAKVEQTAVAAAAVSSIS